MRYLTVLFLTAALAGIASAEITGIEVQSFETPACSDLLDPFTVIPADTYITNDIVVTVDSDWLSAQMLIEPTEPGLIFQHATASGLYNEQSPNSATFPAWACLEYDTYISNGTLGAACGIAPAVDLGDPGVEDPPGSGEYVPVFGTQSSGTPSDRLAIAWFTTGNEVGTLAVARITLSTSAQGTWSFLVTASPADDPENNFFGPKETLLELPIVDGYLVPEPATLGLLAIGGLGVLIRRKR
jgi:hypothetical protein